MASDSEQAGLIAAQSTQARFSIKSLFVAMAVVSVCATLVAPIVRSLEQDAQSRLLVAWGIWLTGAIAWLGYLAHKRFEAEKLVGPTLFRLRMFDERVPTMGSVRRGANVFLAGLMTLAMLFMGSEMVVSPSARGDHWSLVFPSCLSIWWVSRIITSFWWRNHVGLCKRGAIWDRRVLLWDHVVETRCDDSGVLEINGVDQRGLDMRIRVEVPWTDHRDEILQLVQSRAVPNPAFKVKAPFTEVATAPLSVAVKDRRFFMFLLWMAVVYTIIFAFGGVYTGIYEFDHAIFWGVLLQGTLRSLFWRRGWQTGAPLVRLSARPSLLRLGAIGGAAVGAYWVGSRLAVSSEWGEYASGAAFGWSLAAAITAVSWRQLDLLQNGVRFQGGYWPWSEIRVCKWTAGTNRRLVLDCAWQRIVSAVPREQRDAVDAVLREKLTANP